MTEIINLCEMKVGEKTVKTQMVTAFTFAERCLNAETFPGYLVCQVCTHSYRGPRIKVSPERLLSNFRWPTQESNQ
jgi:hypothetical protein